MARQEWFKFMRLAYDELLSEYPNNQGSVEKDLFLQTIEINSDQIPLVSLGDFLTS